jgi:UDP-2,3-diacylglucosamine pyrophosphatase LpxH
MKKFFLFAALVPCLCWAQEKIMVVADPHVLAQSLVQEGKAFDDMMGSQRKMLDLSEAALIAMMDTAMKYRPELLLIPGDLTKDSEKASHELVVNSLKALQEAGIRTLVIPGNHDIGGKAYAYYGDLKVAVDSLLDSEWESTYDFVYSNVTAKDPNSHSYAAEPLPGLTVLGVDGTHKSAATGWLTDQTLAWVLAQADIAKAKNNTIIAMCHWQILEHFDGQGRLESSCRLKNAEAVRDSLMLHGVHLVFTGHFHINGITTYRAGQDSIVEITTGSPITYPCPYRWLTLSQDRKTVEVETEDIMALATRPDLLPYSRQWMAEHAQAMIPQMSLRLWNKADEAKAMLVSQFGETLANRLFDKCIPKTDSAKVALVEKHLGSTIVELYLLHSEANEPENPKADSLAQEVYTGMENMIDEALSADLTIKYTMGTIITKFALSLAEVPVQSLVEDKTQYTSEAPDRTDDLHIRLAVNNVSPQAIKHTEASEKAVKVFRNGQLLILRGEKVFTMQGQQIQ